MKKIKYLLLLAMAVATFNSCEEIDNEVDQIKDGVNLATFEDLSQTESQIAETGEYSIDMKVRLTGVALADVSGDVTVVIAADESATAVEGTHYRIENSTVVLKASNNYLGLFNVTMITEGIVTPLAKQPVLALKIASVTGSNVVASGKVSNLTLSYACPSYLEGAYAATMVRDGASTYTYPEYFTETGIGTYRTIEVGHWIGGLGVGTPGYTFTDVCGELNVPQQDLVDYYGNQVQSTKPGTVDDDGTVNIEYSITSSGWSSVYTCTYVPVK